MLFGLYLACPSLLAIGDILPALGVDVMCTSLLSLA